MAIKVRIPTPLRKITADNSEVTAEGNNIGEIVEYLEKKYPGIKNRICEEDGKIRRFINIYKNDEDIRFLQGQETPVGNNDEISIVPAIAGGR
ncbi:MAG: MoaD/ThiS family protein [Candidatus Firestonebacteria bacterium]|nr:MoaD/ThiS family protein [Candidatus Firestonebacteria bacterium]